MTGRVYGSDNGRVKGGGLMYREDNTVVAVVGVLLFLALIRSVYLDAQEAQDSWRRACEEEQPHQVEECLERYEDTTGGHIYVPLMGR